MSAADVPSVKRALLDRLRAEPALHGVQIAYGYPARDMEREVLYGGAARYTRTIDSLGMGGISYRRNITVDLHLQVRIPGGEVQDAEDRVTELGVAVEAFLDANSQLDLAGLLYSGLTSGELGYAIDDDAVTSALQLQVEFSSYPA